ncbi:MAG: hypothetical protein WC554_09560 [Clostridia bacterium]
MEEIKDGTVTQVAEPTTTILSADGIYRGNFDSNIIYYQVVAKDTQGNSYVCTFGVPIIYQERIEKAFRVLIPIPFKPPEPEPTKEEKVQ